MANVRVAVDIGGTFTDICILDQDSGLIRIAKVPSTRDLIDGALAGLKKANVDLKNVELFCHGTTVATNALITRQLPRAAMVTTKGFRDIIEVRRATKEDLWDAYKDTVPPYIRRRDRLGVMERIDYAGNIVTPLDEVEAREVARILRERQIEAVAVCFMNAYANAANEKRMREILLEESPGIEVSISSEVLPEIFEHERFSTTVVNAMLRPVVGEYVERMSERLRSDGYKGDVLLLHSGGGVMTTNTARHFAARFASSGIAAGAIASRYIGKLCGFDNSIGLDMGGTSCDISLTYEGQSTVTKDWYIEYGYPICFPSIEIKTIGAGGGSLAWIDEAGSLRNGPQSAGASPGPACYDQGGEQPTNTDANLLLGRLGPSLVGGDVSLNIGKAEVAIRKYIAKPLGLEPREAANAIIQVANANMADAVRLVSIMRGHDPRDFALVAFGGAGALHGAALAKDLSIPTVIVPPHPGVTSALGCLLVDIRHDLAFTYFANASEANPKKIEEIFQELEQEARKLLGAEAVAPDEVILHRAIDMRYLGQWRSIAVPVPSPFESIEQATQQFQEFHQREYNYRREDAPVEIYRLNLTAIGTTPKAELAKHAASGKTCKPASKRQVLFDEEDSRLDTPVFVRADLPVGAAIKGPAVIEQLDSTTLVPPSAQAEVDEWLNIRIYVREDTI